MTRMTFKEIEAAKEEAITVAMRGGIFTEEDMRGLYEKGFDLGYKAGLFDGTALVKDLLKKKNAKKPTSQQTSL